jgi:diguanylate cyclase (GGDEF)-like protein
MGKAHRVSSAVRQIQRPIPTSLTPAGRAPRALQVAYGVMAALLAAYIVALIVRRPNTHWPWIDGWGVVAFEVIGVSLLLARAFVKGPRQTVALVLGTAVFAWALGDGVLTWETWNGARAPNPSLADLFYACFFPLAYAAVVLMLRKEIKRMLPATWLDGAVAGLGAAAVCAAFAFVSAFAEPVNLIYPVGDVLLLALVVGGTAVLPGRRLPWMLVAAACGINSIGDTFNLFASSGVSTTHVGDVVDGIAWPTAILMISIAVWVPAGRRDLLQTGKVPGFVLPGIGALAGLGILFVGAIHRVSPVALGLATATLVVVGLRLGLSVRGLRTLTAERHRQAVTDELTGLGNRRRLNTLLDDFFADYADPETPTRNLAFLFVDLDHFKQINDSFGHSAGDELLRQLGPRLTGSLRSTDVLIRIGGDELGAVLIDTDPVYAAGLAQRLTALLEQPFVLNGLSVRISASIGIAMAPTDAIDSVGLMRCADVAMYRAKLGQRSYEIYQPDIDDGGNRLVLVDELRAAVDRRELVLHYQPQVDLRSGETAAVEALVRWPHPRLGLIPPLDFLPLAEEAGLMSQLTQLVLDQALMQCAAWWAAGTRLAVSVNISSSNLLDPGFIDMVRGALRRHQVPASSLILEITETTIIRDFEGSKHVIDELRGLGLGISIDDFGSGFTSLAYLGSLAVTELKLDRTFIQGLIADGREQDVKLVRATIELGHALELTVVAEGIETCATLELLALLGCDRAQGYFTGRPVPAEALDLSDSSLTIAPRFATAV